mmetsp:Transcript_2527/g.3856  ORF Transcript_2527/g.3856 Transcript_2527/m.3856 type:complete len:343 (+) Transcript_2527:70-1098(+)|eukprot:CAMPEP_0194202750 /NCGR_PEP_ID=MMETSP0156-20130528/2692_1 /TAXON_ID=33649 /ORGANISM="Thalassionema nitzschioides, Strain L26-B" /LENGTH=342 /DNA_ID=CAMNT_0038928329 /DNA_START=46 /DNA_END=1074 /DNA_ORIENTATION=+
MRIIQIVALLAISLPMGVHSEFRNLRSMVASSPGARTSLADALLSAIRSPTREVEESLLKAAEITGLGREQVRHMARTLTKKMETEGTKPEELEKEIKRLREVPKEKPVNVGDVYKPKGSWTYSFKQTRALSKAVLTAVRSSDGSVDPDALENAVAEGVDPSDILQSVEAMRKLRQKHSKPKAETDAAKTDTTSTEYKYADEEEMDRKLKKEPSSTATAEKSNSQSKKNTAVTEQKTTIYEYADEDEVPSAEIPNERRAEATKSAVKTEAKMLRQSNSPARTRALSKAVLSGMKSSTGAVDPTAMKEAMDAGWTKDDIDSSIAAAQPQKKTSDTTSTYEYAD